MVLLLKGMNAQEVIRELIEDVKYKYLTRFHETITEPGPDFSRETKSEAFIREALASALQCKICGGYIHRNSMTVDHINRKQNGGLGSIENAQLAHPYCNSTVKN
jgi:5-methylcytosine-specific restriction endonuclease McrA